MKGGIYLGYNLLARRGTQVQARGFLSVSREFLRELFCALELHHGRMEGELVGILLIVLYMLFTRGYPASPLELGEGSRGSLSIHRARLRGFSTAGTGICQRAAWTMSPVVCILRNSNLDRHERCGEISLPSKLSLPPRTSTYLEVQRDLGVGLPNVRHSLGKRGGHTAHQGLLTQPR
jgi:hypothetical protein